MKWSLRSCESKDDFNIFSNLISNAVIVYKDALNAKGIKEDVREGLEVAWPDDHKEIKKAVREQVEMIRSVMSGRSVINSCFLIVNEEDCFMSKIGAVWVQPSEYEKTFYISYLYIVPFHRRKGIGSNATKVVSGYLRSLGYRVIIAPSQLNEAACRCARRSIELINRSIELINKGEIK